MSKESDPFEPQDPQSRYDDALLRANWNPVIELLQASGAGISSRSRRSSARDVSDEEANAFLGRIYASGA
jgi:hypothetical protein